MTHALAAAATFVLSATMPTLDAPGDDSTRLCLDLASCIVYQSVPSATYYANEAYLRGPGFATARGDSLWRIVRSETAPHQVASMGLVWQDRGTRKSFTLPDSLRGTFWMRTRDTNLNESAESNAVTR